MLKIWGPGALPFVAVGRVRDSAVLASWLSNDVPKEHEREALQMFQQVLQASARKLSAGERARLTWNQGSICCMMDQTAAYLYCVQTSTLAYPERSAYQFLYDLVMEVQPTPGLECLSQRDLTPVLRPRMQALVRVYEEQPKDADPGPRWSFDSEPLGSHLLDEPVASVPSKIKMKMLGRKRLILYCALALLTLLVAGVFIWHNLLGGSSRTKTMSRGVETLEVDARRFLGGLRGAFGP